ncbi:transcriptional regulator [Streptomyces cinnamoneus]|uniref:Transcriptional regulator n=1 Tax=Streptomyces cinnamoneus TaxID=53446 RepID=A0A2G1XNR9_STRCJ|nr:LysR family transcriptional regulator [Streptomyces cinnamoneus]PHQ52789.1 transcriptional regulator [Streptomyces cinnamoneus]PPT11891.1 transcriptional regulator [Streptomyces cinnamoneus]
MPLNLPQLRAFVAVVDAGGFGTAATDLGLSQSAVSHAVASLERILAGPLLVRSTPVRTTALGERVLPHARAAVSATDALRDAAARHGSEVSGTVRLASTPTVCQGLLPALQRHWSAHLPGVRVRVFEGSSDEAVTWLENGAADAVIVADPPSGAGTPLVTDPFLALLPQDHPLARENAVHVSDLEDDPLILSPNGCERHVHRIHRAAGTPFSPAHRVRDLGTLISMVQAGMGISILPRVSRPLLPTDLVLVPVEPRYCRRLVLCGPEGRPWSPAVRALADSVETLPRAVLDDA